MLKVKDWILLIVLVMALQAVTRATTYRYTGVEVTALRTVLQNHATALGNLNSKIAQICEKLDGVAAATSESTFPTDFVDELDNGTAAVTSTDTIHTVAR